MRIKATYIPQKFCPSNATTVIIVAILPSFEGSYADVIAIPSDGRYFIQDSIRRFIDIEWPRE